MTTGDPEAGAAGTEWSGLPRRTLLAIAVLGVVAAIGYTFAPVDQDAISYSLQLGELPATGGFVVAPLAVAQMEPDQLLVTLPCDEPGSEFASVRRPDDFELFASVSQPSPFALPSLGDGVRLEITSDRAALWLGSENLLSAPIYRAEDCIVRLMYEDGLWTMQVQDLSSTTQGRAPRFSEAAFSGPAASSRLSTVSVRTSELGTSPSALQIALFMLTLGCVVVSLTAVSRESGGRSERAPSAVLRFWQRTVGLVALVDVVVVVFLIGWLVLLPPQIDEGWNRVIAGGYDEHGDFFGLYVDGVGQSPFGYWLYWIQTRWLSFAGSPAVMRGLPLAFGVGTWAGLRSIGRSHGVPGAGGSHWLMAAVYVIGFGAFGMTLRAEPIVMALLVASTAIALRFANSPRAHLLTAWVLVVALALSGHTSGVVVLAPVLLSWRNIWGWIQSSRGGVVAAVHGLSLLSLSTVLLFFDSNMGSKMETLRAVRSDGQHGFGVLDERMRYDFLADHGPTMHRFFVVAMIIAVGALLLRSRKRDLGSRLPARTLAVGLVLLALTPSKWFWHFGGLAPIAALAVAIEFRAVQGWRRIVILGGMVVAMSWVWSDALSWTDFDLRTQRWWPGAVNFLPIDLSKPLSWIVLASFVWVLVLLIRRWRPAFASWSPVDATALLAAGLVIVVTAATFVLDVARTDGWTYGKQSLSELVGSGDCGLGEEILVPARGSADEASLSVNDGTFASDALVEWVPVSALANLSADVMITPELVQYFSCIDLPLISDGVVDPPDVMMLTPVIAWQTTFVSAALSDDYYRVPAPVPPRGDDGTMIIIVSHEYLTGSPARATHQFQIDSG